MEPWVPVTAGDIAARWRALTAEETVVVVQIIADAQDIVESALLDAGVTTPPSDERWQRAYKRVVASMVIRVMKNPNGYLTETVDDYSYRRDSAVSSGALYLSDAELADLIPSDRGRRRRGAFTIVLGG